MGEYLFALIVKAKSHLIAIFIAYVAATIRYVQYKRKIDTGTLSPDKIKMATLRDWFLFGIMATIITLTGLAVIEWMGYELNFIFAIGIFWAGYLTDSLYQWIPLLIKEKLKDKTGVDIEIQD